MPLFLNRTELLTVKGSASASSSSEMVVVVVMLAEVGRGQGGFWLERPGGILVGDVVGRLQPRSWRGFLAIDEGKEGKSCDVWWPWG